MKMVRFDIWCKECKYCDIDGNKDPCYSCLSMKSSPNSNVPVLFKGIVDRGRTGGNK